LLRRQRFETERDGKVLPKHSQRVDAGIRYADRKAHGVSQSLFGGNASPGDYRLMHKG